MAKVQYTGTTARKNYYYVQALLYLHTTIKLEQPVEEGIKLYLVTEADDQDRADWLAEYQRARLDSAWFTTRAL